MVSGHAAEAQTVMIPHLLETFGSGLSSQSNFDVAFHGADVVVDMTVTRDGEPVKHDGKDVCNPCTMTFDKSKLSGTASFANAGAVRSKTQQLDLQI